MSQAPTISAATTITSRPPLLSTGHEPAGRPNAGTCDSAAAPRVRESCQRTTGKAETSLSTLERPAGKPTGKFHEHDQQ